MKFISSLQAVILNVVLLPLAYANSLSKENDLGELLFANVLYRHGDRTPLDPCPNDPYKNASFWPVGFGQLTNTGKEQEYELGLWLRNRYSSLLTQDYSPETLYVQSTDVDRTLMSAASVLAGMYPPSDRQRWNLHLDWQPIPIHTLSEKDDKVLAANVPCPAYKEEHEKVLQSQQIQDLNRKYSDVYKILNEHCGRNVTQLLDIEYIYNTLYIEALNNFSLPEWTKDVFPQPMEEVSKLSFALPTWTLKLARLKSGLLVQDMISHMKDRVERKPQPKMWMYSAHDSTIANLLNTLNVFDLQNPPYSSAVLMELRADSSGNHHVYLYYRNSTQHEPYLLTLPGCAPACPLDQFILHCEPLIPQDWDRECHSTSLFGITPPLPYSTLTIAALVISSLLILLLVVSVILYWQRRKQPTHWLQIATTSLLPLKSSLTSQEEREWSKNNYSQRFKPVRTTALHNRFWFLGMVTNHFYQHQILSLIRRQPRHKFEYRPLV